MDPQAKRGLRHAAERRGQDAEDQAEAALVARGWTVLERRLRASRGSGAGELDMVAARDGLLAFIEVKARPSLSAAAHAVSRNQQARLMAAAEAWLAAHPGHGAAGVRFDVILVAPEGMRRIKDAFRAWD